MSSLSSSSIRVQDLRKSFLRTRRQSGLRGAVSSFLRPQREEVVAVDGVSFEVASGEAVAFIGPNGAGKSTTIKMLTGILHPSSGSASVLGLVPWRDRRRLVARLGCVFGQRSQLWYHLPVAETFTLLAHVYDLERGAAARRLAELCELFELTELLDLPVRKLSLGQRMRCELAASLLHRPEIVFLDEPTIGLDVVARGRIRELLVRLNEQDGVTVFLTSHDAGDIESTCNRVILIDHGRVMLDTSVVDLKRDHLREKTISALLEEERIDINMPGVEVLSSGEHRIELRVDTRVSAVEAVLAAIVSKARVRDITVSDPSLERVIASTYEGGGSS